MPVVITVHGVESLAIWFNTIQPTLSGIEGLIHCPHTYGDTRTLRKRGKFRLWRAFSEHTRRKAKIEFLQLYDSVLEEYKEVPSIIAHSFGTYVVAEVFRQYKGVQYDAVVLCGGIVAEDFEWDPTRVKRVRNEIAGRDGVVKWLSYERVRNLIPDSGLSGIGGFTRDQAHVCNVRFPDYGHSTFFTSKSHCADHWVPFLLDVEDFKRTCQACAGATNLEAERRFDAVYGHFIENEVNIQFMFHPTHIKHAAKRFVRREMIDKGALGREQPQGIARKAAYSALLQVVHPRRD